MEDLTLVQTVISSGPWGLVAVLGWAFWRTIGRREVETILFYERFIELSEKQIASSLRMEVALGNVEKCSSEKLRA
jgi:hypothetical protein